MPCAMDGYTSTRHFDKDLRTPVLPNDIWYLILGQVGFSCSVVCPPIIHRLNIVKLARDDLFAVFELSVTSRNLRCLTIPFIYRSIHVSEQQLLSLDDSRYACGGTIRRKIVSYTREVIVVDVVPQETLNSLLISIENLEYLR